MDNDTEATKASPERKTLVSIEIQKEYDVLEKRWDHRVFVKLYIAARTSGLLAAMSDRDWKTMTVLSTFMDENGVCFPSQEQIAQALKINRSSANRRIQSLLRFRFEGKPVLLVEKRRKPGGIGRQFASNVYTIMPVTHLKIFDRNDEKD